MTANQPMKQAKRWIKIEEPKLVQREGKVELAAEISSSDASISPFKLWYRFPLEFQDYITLSGDPFLAALLPVAMKKKYDLILNACVSERLHVNSRQVMTILSRWFDYMEPVNIQAKRLIPADYNSKGVGSFFTGGVDSFYTVLKNLDSFHDESRISHLLYVHGFDIDIANKKLFKKVCSHLTTCADELELQLLIISTNLRKLSDSHISWGKHEYGAALASTGLSLSKLFKTILIPSSHPFTEVYPTGIHPILDPLWSNESTQFMEDGNEADRNQKIKWQLSKNPIALAHLRVCWKNPDNSYNCGKCAKCIRTKINLRLAGVLEKCKTLDEDIDFELLKKQTINDSKERRMLKESLHYVELYGKDDEIKEGLKYIIANTRENISLRKRVKDFDAKFLKGGIRKLIQ